MERTSHRGPEPVESLDRETCTQLLAEGGVACLGLQGNAAPLLRPVNFLLRDAEIVIRTGEGGRILEAARREERASLALDGIDRVEHTGWSVVVVGGLKELAADDTTAKLPLRAWASGQKDRFVALALEEVSGLRIPSGRGNR